MIAFIGSVFSPRYYKARRAGLTTGPDPLRYCAINIALHGPNGQHSWVFNEYPQEMVETTSQALRIGGTKLSKQSGDLVINCDERTRPFFERMAPRLSGEIVLTPTTWYDQAFSLDEQGEHQWIGVAPSARLTARFNHPDLTFSGSAYHDVNMGSAPLEDAFRFWTWSRAEVQEGTAVIYDVHRSNGSEVKSSRLYRPDGTIETFNADKSWQLPGGRWGVSRETRSDPGCSPRVVRTLVDSPFYNRSVIETTLMGQRVKSIHESVNLDRFRQRWVRFLLPWRIETHRGRR